MKEKWVTGNIGITVQDQPLNFEVTVPADPVKITRMLPIFQQMTNTMVGLGIKAAESDGRSISCKAGCGACCRQPVPITEAEIFHLAELVEQMEEPRRSDVKKRFADAVDHFTQMGWFENVSKCAEMVSNGHTEEGHKRLIELVDQYFVENINCPFLVDDACSVHRSRPLACREYLVTSPAEYCDHPDPVNIEMVEMLFQPSKIVSKISSTGLFADEGIITLIKAIEFAAAKKESTQTKSGEGWMADFFQDLAASEVRQQQTAQPNSNKRRAISSKRKKKK